MNSGIEKHASPATHYYDGDYPSERFSRFPENFDATVHLQGLAHDVTRYLELAAAESGPVLDLCCGTGRVALPLAEAGWAVTGVDFSAELLQQCAAKLEKLAPEKRRNLRLVEQDITQLDLGEQRFRFALCAFNSLLCLTDFSAQLAALERVREHLVPGGLLALDLMSPFALNPAGNPVPTPFFTRKNPHNGNTYTRFACQGPMREDQSQELYGWYDEIRPDGTLARQHYSVRWRPIYRYELQLMLEKTGFALEWIHGGHRGEAFTTGCRKMFVGCRRRE